MNEYIEQSIKRMIDATFDEEEKMNRDLINGFKSFVLEKYNIYFKEANNQDFQNGIEMQVMLIDCKNYKDLPTSLKKSLFITDTNMEILSRTSESIFSKAINKLEDNTSTYSEEEIDNELSIVKEKYNLVHEENKEHAAELLSETILDANFIKKSTDVMSLRLYAYKEKVDNIQSSEEKAK